MPLPILFGIAGIFVLVVLVVFLYATWVAHKMTLMERVPVSGHPSRLGLEWQDVVFQSREDKVVLSGWYLPAGKDTACIILIQGTHLNRNDPAIRALQLGKDLVHKGFSVLLFDLRARGQSAGVRSSEGDREQQDLLGAIDYVQSRGIAPERIGLLGFSLGAGVAILVAAKEPRIAAVVSDSGFLDYMMDLKSLRLGPFPLPSWFGMLVALAGRLFFHADFSNVRPAKAVGELAQPVFFIHGTRDSVISPQETKKLHSISDNEEDRIWIVPGAEHVSVYRTMPREYVERVFRFFSRHITLDSPV